jgi:hypothetical protein
MTSLWKRFISKYQRQRNHGYVMPTQAPRVFVLPSKELTEIEAKILDNGLLLENINPAWRTEFMCVQAMKWAYKTGDDNNQLHIISLIPQQILVDTFIVATSSLSKSPLTKLEAKISKKGLLLENVNPILRTENMCFQALKWAFKTGNDINKKRIINLIPQFIFVRTFIWANARLFGSLLDFCDES